jgi:hypothetical protein
VIAAMRKGLFDKLQSSGGMQIPLRRPAGEQFYDRKLQR